MAAPASPTLVSITTEGLKKAGYENPTADELARAQDEWMEEIKNDIWNAAKKLKTLQKEAVISTTKGVYRYSLPTDFSSINGEMVLMEGTETGTAQTGAAGSITLQANETFLEGFIQGKEILITGGTGVNQISQVYAYNSTTKVASVSPSWATNPSTDSTYLIIDTYYPLQENPVWNFHKENYPTNLERPAIFNVIGDSDDGEFYLFKTPDKAYGVKIPYYANLMKIDLVSTLMTTVYQRWRNIFVQGILVKALQTISDPNQAIEEQKYMNLFKLIIGREQYGTDITNLQMVVQN